MRSRAKHKGAIPLTEPAEIEKPLNKRQASKIQTRLKALAAARELFTEKGFGATTMRALAKAMGMSTGAIFANFVTKEDLLLSVMEEDRVALAVWVREANCKLVEEGRSTVQALLADYDFFAPRFRMLEEMRYLEGRGIKGASDFLEARRRQVSAILLPGLDPLDFEILWSTYDALSRRAMREGLARDRVEGDLHRLSSRISADASP